MLVAREAGLHGLHVELASSDVSRIFLSPPDVDSADKAAIARAFDGGWIAPLGPEVDAFEAELAHATGRRHAVALASGTAALHLGLLTAGVHDGDRVLVSSLTFSATVNAIRYVGAMPVFVDSEPASWNMDPGLLQIALENGPYAAIVSVDLYGQCCNYGEIESLASARGVPLIEDAAEALGGQYETRPAGSFGLAAALSFNGNKIITTSGGGALVTDDEEMAERARYLATQARQPTPHYEHTEVGYNYRLSNLLAALGRSQLCDLERRVEARRQHNDAYRSALGHLPGIEFMPEAPRARSTFWLTCLTIDPARAPVDREDVRKHLEDQDIEARPVWKPMHLQPAFAEFESYGGTVSERLFEHGLCLPSGSSLSEVERRTVIDSILEVFGGRS